MVSCGDFDKAAPSLSLKDTPEAHYNVGNAWLMQGKYQSAIESYDRASSRRPDWIAALENRNLAKPAPNLWKARVVTWAINKSVRTKVGYDKNANNEGQDTEVQGKSPCPTPPFKSFGFAEYRLVQQTSFEPNSPIKKARQRLEE